MSVFMSTDMYLCVYVHVCDLFIRQLIRSEGRCTVTMKIMITIMMMTKCTYSGSNHNDQT